MKYLFTYVYRGVQDGVSPVNGHGSLIITSESDRITPELIYGSNGAVEIAKRAIGESNISVIDCCPIGWFKFDSGIRIGEHEMTKENALSHLEELMKRMDSTDEFIQVSDLSLEAVEMAFEALQKVEVD